MHSETIYSIILVLLFSMTVLYVRQVYLYFRGRC